MLVLLPTSKLMAEWQGPYQVTKRVGKVHYQVDMHDRRKRKRIFHINMFQETLVILMSVSWKMCQFGRRAHLQVIMKINL